MENNNVTLDSLASLCKRRGFIFQSSEIYGGINGFWDYGPLGCELKRNIRDAWWRDTVQRREDVVGLDASIIMHPRVWEASGHLSDFADPMQTCQQCKKLYRADQVMEMVAESAWLKSLIETCGVTVDKGSIEFDSARALRWAEQRGRHLAPGLALVRNPAVTLSCLAEYIEKHPGEIVDTATLVRHFATEQLVVTGLVTPCPSCGGDLTERRQFNLMFKTHAGAMEDSASAVYLRPETAQGIFCNFNNILATARQKVPFGIAQVGKAFRNEINPRNYTFRSREFEQMELEFFIKPGTDQQWHEYWVAERLKWYRSIGLPEESLSQYVYKKEELAHYASACVDIMFAFPFGVQELEGIAARGDYDLRRHQEFSGKGMDYFDADTKEKFVPHVVEPSAGVDRIALALLCNAYREEWIKSGPEESGGGEIAPAEAGKQPPAGYELRTVMRFAPRIAPIKAAVFPLLKNKPELVDKARAVFEDLRRRWPCFYDQIGAIGRRYRRQDEAGTPFGITVDFKTLEDDTVTLRDRDTMRQERLPIGELPKRIQAVLD